MTATLNMHEEWFEAVMMGDHLMIENLLKQGFDIDTQDSNGMTALMHCVTRHYIVMGDLIEYGADLDVKDASGKTALELARAKNKIDSIKILSAAARWRAHQALEKQKLAVVFRDTMVARVTSLTSKHDASATSQDLIRSARPVITVRARPA